MALNYQQPNDPGVEVRNRWSRGLEGIYEAYQLAKQNGRADQAAALQAQLGQQQLLQGRQQLAQGQRQSDMADIQETAQLGAPLASFSAEDRARAGAGITQGPGDQAGQDRLRKFAEGLHALSERPKLAAREQMAGIGLTEAKTQNELAEAGKRGKEAEIAGAGRGMKAEGDLRGELQNLSKPFIMVRDSMGRIEAAAKNPTAAGDLALIFNYMKVLDPGSTVREGEFATAQNSAGVPERLKAKYNQVISGERLADDQRQDFVSRARDLYQSQASIQKQQEQQYRGLAERMGARPENVILNQNLPTARTGGDPLGLFK